MNEFKVNEYLTLKLENDETIIYVKGKQFNQCKFLLLEIPINEITLLEDLKSIDEAAERLTNILELIKGKRIDKIPPKTEFWGHCSNLQVWFEYNYDTRLLHSNLSFSLLRKLSELGDPLANKVFKEEIVKRFHSGYIPSIYYLIKEGYLNYLNNDEIKLIFFENNIKLKQQLENIDKNLVDESFYILKKLIKIGDPHTNKVLKKAIGNLTSIKKLDLSGNKLTELPETIGNLNSLHNLNLFWNILTKLPETIGFLTLLKELKLGNNKLKELPEAIGNLRLLQKLDLNNNQITGLPESIGNLTLLQSLGLTNNQITGLPESIGNLTSLQKLDLSNNQVTELPESTGELRSLQKLDLRDNRVIKLPESTGELRSLQVLYLNGNKITELPESIGNFTSLQKLDLRDNRVIKLPESIGNLTSLQKLDLRNNQITELPESIGNLTSLQILDFSYNKLTIFIDSKRKDIIERLKKKGVIILEQI